MREMLGRGLACLLQILHRLARGLDCTLLTQIKRAEHSKRRLTCLGVASISVIPKRRQTRVSQLRGNRLFGVD